MSRSPAAGPRRAAVLGSPIAHSLSPVLHRTAYRVLGIEATYDAIEMDTAGLASFCRGLGPEWMGLSLTMPLKRAVLPLLDEVSPTAVDVGAANTVVVAGGRLHGHNTDVEGIERSLDEAARSLTGDVGADGASDAQVLVIGAGATAMSTLAALARRGATRVRLVARDRDRARPAAEAAERLGIVATIEPLEEGRAVRVGDAAVVVCTLPGPAAPHLDLPARPGVLLDVSYDPWPGALVPVWRAAGGAAADGLDLLLWQAVGQVRLMTGLEPPIDEMRSALQAAARDRG